MAPSHSFFVLFLLFVSYFSSLVHAAPWFVTRYYEPKLFTDGYGYTDAYTTITPSVVTAIVEATPTASIPTALSTTTMTTSYYNAGPVTVVQVLLPSDAPVATGYDTYDDDYALTSYFIDLVYTAPTVCSSQWTTTTAVPLYVPRNIQDVLKPSSTSMSYSVDNRRPFQPTTITHLRAWIDPAQIPESHLSELRSFYEPYDPSCSYSTGYNGEFDDGNDDTSSDSGSTYDGSSNNEGSSDYNSGSTYDSSSGSGYYNGNGYNDYNWLYDDYWYGISPLAIILIVILCWFGIWFIIGLIEN